MIYSIENIIEDSKLHYKMFRTDKKSYVCPKQNLNNLLSNLKYLARDGQVLSIKLNPTIKEQIKADYEKSILKPPR